MRGLDLFAGIGGASIAMHRAGIGVVAHAEIEPFPCRVLEHRFPRVPNLGNVAEITAEVLATLGRIDIVSFGSPCQDWSVAGKRLGLKGHRSSLFHEAVRIIRLCQPRFAVFENVPGLFSSARGWDFASVLDEMAESGALDIAWRVLDAQWFGVPQRRRRIFLVADFRGERAGEILSISEGVFRHPAPSREAGEATPSGFAPSVEATLGSRAGYTELDGHGAYIPEVAPAIRSNYRSDHVGDESRLIPELAGCLTSRYDKGSNTSVDDGALVLGFHSTQDPVTREDGTPCIGTGNSGGYGSMAVHDGRLGMTVRRLTPKECERVQGFPDGWTEIPGASDSARYRALGNAWAVPVGEWVMRRISGVSHEKQAVA